MRIVIDFLDTRDEIAPAALALARDMAQAAEGGEVWIAAPLRAPKAIAALRLACAGVLPPARIRAFALPPPGRIAAMVRRHALAGLEPDAVLLMAGPGGSAQPGFGLPVVVAEPRDASATYLWRQLAAAARDAAAPAPAQQRPRLAFIAPLPPSKSGIADYAAELAPELAQYYDIELVVDQDSVDDARLAGFPLRRVESFRECAHQYDRLLYHFGNSHAHQHMFELLRAHPGTVVLHDFFLSGVLDNLEREAYLPHGFLKALYESHGYTGLLHHREDGRNAAIWKYPLNKGVLDNAAGVIVHSGFARQLAADWYGEHGAGDWRVIPLLRGKPEGWCGPDARRRARARLKLADGDFVFCSFGMLGPTKLNEELLDAFLASRLAADPHCLLVFVGANDPGLYGAGLAQRIAASGAAARIRITGYAERATYADYLAAADGAVQLRRATRGESSASVLDCLLFGVPTIVNAHGASAELPGTLLFKLPDEVTVPELAAALERLHGDATLRAELSGCAQAYMQAGHTPAHAARLYAGAIEHFARHGRHAHYQALVRQVAPLAGAADLPALAAAIAFNRAPLAPRQLLVDVSAIVESDLKTGIQRVVRSVLLALIADPPPGWRIEPVFSTGGGHGYRYARRFGLSLVGEAALELEDAPAELRPGDIFLGLDLFTNGTSQNQDLLQSMRERGVGIYFVVYDLLPVLRPEVFPFGAEQYFGDFLRTVHAVSDGVLCISRAVADELVAWFDREGLARRAPLAIGWFHLGADIDASAPSSGLPPDAGQVLSALAARPSFLMVGTLEPRKGHAQALAAFELLWAEGIDVNLVIVGKQGWMVEQLAARMAGHPERDRRLFWLAGISDEMLVKLYAGAAALLQPSEGEGFGLPLIEAAQHGVPIIARDLPVFREVAGEHACYFNGLEAVDLAGTVSAWLDLRRAGAVPPSSGMQWLTWAESARQVLDALVREQWYRVV
jgi:glycosyltransferase involved in cell wall biosynthesis